MKAFRSKLIRRVIVTASGATIAAFTTLAYQHTQNFRSLFLSGEQHFRQKQYSRALADFSAAHSRNPADERTSRYLALTYTLLDRPGEAAALLAAMGRKPQSATSGESSPPAGGEMLNNNVSMPSPASDFHRGVSEGMASIASTVRGVFLPEDEYALRRQITAYEIAGNPERTLALYERLIALHPKEMQLALGAARNYSWAKRYDRAIELYAVVLGSSAATDAIRCEHAEVLFWNREYGAAAEQYRRVASRATLTKRHSINYGVTLMALGNNTESSMVLEALAARFPNDPDVVRAAAEACFASRRYDRAGAYFGSISRMLPDDPHPMTRRAEIAALELRFRDAIALSREVLQRYPDNQDALLTIARVSSWQRDYRTSLDAYDRLLAGASRDEALKYGREKARVLSWKQDYGRSIRLYDELLAAYPDNLALRQEVAVEKSYYRTAYRSAEQALEGWLAIEKDNPEALFELGQIYFQQERWAEAMRAYDHLLSISPNHRNAKEAREKLAVLASMTRVSGGVTHFTSRSVDRRNDVHFSSIHTAINHPLSEDVSVFLNQERRQYRFESSSMKPVSLGVTGGIEYQGMPDIFVRAGLGHRWNSEGPGDSWNGFVHVESNPLDNLHLGGAYRHDDVIENPTTFEHHLQTNSWKSFAYFDGYRRWNAHADYTIDDYSDGNRRVTAGAGVMVHLSYEPRRLSLTYRLQDFGFSRSSDSYFSPSSFTTHTAGIEWQHHLNRRELFRGGDDTWYSAAYRISIEPDGNFSHQVHAGVHKDWNRRFSTSLEYQRSWNDHREIYHDDMLNAGVNWYFK